MNRMNARVWVSEKDVLEVERGIPAYAIWNNKRIDGKVVEVDMALDPKTQAFGAVVEFNNPSMILKFGITVDVFIETYTKSDAIVVELKDLLEENDKYYVYTIENDKAVKKPVVTGRGYKLTMEILEGLTAGDNIVVEGQMLLEPEAKVRIIK
jgi:RND family efflux transporter MFP subunit